MFTFQRFVHCDFCGTSPIRNTCNTQVCLLWKQQLCSSWIRKIRLVSVVHLAIYDVQSASRLKLLWTRLAVRTLFLLFLNETMTKCWLTQTQQNEWRYTAYALLYARELSRQLFDKPSESSQARFARSHVCSNLSRHENKKGKWRNQIQ